MTHRTRRALTTAAENRILRKHPAVRTIKKAVKIVKTAKRINRKLKSKASKR